MRIKNVSNALGLAALLLAAAGNAIAADGLSGAATASPRPEPAGNAEAGRNKAQVCAACHGTDGNSPNPIWPNLAGQHDAYLAKQIWDYREDRRRNEQMSAMVAPLSEEDIADLAAYYSEQTAKRGVASPEWVRLGQRIYRYGNPKAEVPACMGCHGPKGGGNPLAGYPTLGGQHIEYTVAQLKAFQAGMRDNDRDAVMRSIASRMSAREMQAVAEYIAGLH